MYYPRLFYSIVSGLINDYDQHIYSKINFSSDPENFPEPYKFNPDNFTKENIESRHKYSYLSFGEGPRICVGMKFALAQSKAGIAKILSKYNVTLSSKTDQPLKIAKGSFLLVAENGIYLHLTKRTDV